MFFAGMSVILWPAFLLTVLFLCIFFVVTTVASTIEPSCPDGIAHCVGKSITNIANDFGAGVDQANEQPLFDAGMLDAGY
jgi:hypothetical protein